MLALGLCAAPAVSGIAALEDRPVADRPSLSAPLPPPLPVPDDDTAALLREKQAARQELERLKLVEPSSTDRTLSYALFVMGPCVLLLFLIALLRGS